jgi:hypothetical protein
MNRTKAAVSSLKLVVALGLLISGQTPLLAQNDLSQDPVFRAFQRYKTAILNDDAATALASIDSKTLQFYQNALDDALHLSAPRTQGLPFVTMLTVLQIRHNLPPETVRQMNGATLFEYAIASGWIGKNSVSNLDVVRVEKDGDFAVAWYARNGAESPEGFQFNRENGVWKIDLTSAMPTANLAMTRLAEERGVSQEELAVLLLEAASSRVTDDTIWQPLDR